MKFNHTKFARDFATVCATRNMSIYRASQQFPVVRLCGKVRAPKTITPTDRVHMAQWADLNLAQYEIHEEPQPLAKPEYHGETCGCSHHDSLTCLAEREHETRFNTMMLHARGDWRDITIWCPCLCHRDARGHQIAEEAWKPIPKRRKAA